MNKNTISIISLAVISLVIVGIAVSLLFSNSGSKTSDNTNPNQQTTGYEPQSLNFNDSDANQTIDSVLNDTDKSLNTTTNDSNFQQLDTQSDFGINN